MSSKPNIIFIMCDQMRGDCMGNDGNEVIHTPNLDSLALRGTRFNHAYTEVPSCLPARAILWSGQNQWNAGLLGMGWGQGPTPNDYPHTLAGELTADGYQTRMVGKGHFTPQRTLMGFEKTELDESGRTLVHGFKDAYREWFDEQTPEYVTPDDHGVNWNAWQARPWHTEEYLHPTAWTMQRSIDFLKSREKEKPFFLNISFARPHSPYVPPQPYWDMYIDKKLPEPAVGDWAVMHDDPETAADVNAWRGKMSAEQIHRARAGYYGEISFIDAQIGRLVNWMERFDRDTFNNTWFVFTADHGDMQGDHNLWRKTYAYEGSTRIPFLVIPSLSSGKPVNDIAAEPVGLQDIMPTVLDAAGVDIPATVDGCSVLPLMQNNEPHEWRGYMHGEHCSCYAREQEMQYVTDGKRKFVWLPRIGVEQFFNLETDPGECVNLIDAKDYQIEIEQWRNNLVVELDKRDCGWVKDGKLFCPIDEPMVSPYLNTRRTV
jgi:arylsulfatase